MPNLFPRHRPLLRSASRVGAPLPPWSRVPAFSRSRRPVHFLVLLLFLSPLSAFSQKGTLISVLHADSLVGKTVDNTEYRELVGNVRLKQDDVIITCDRAMQNLTANSARLSGNVVVTQDTLVLKAISGEYDGDTKTASSTLPLFLSDGHVSLKAQRGRYDTKRKIAWFSRDVIVEDSLVTILSQDLVYERDSSKATATEKVVLLGKRENLTINADTAIHWHSRNVSILPSHPRLWQVDTTVLRRDSLSGRVDSLRLDTLYLTARHMEAHRDSSNFFLAEEAVELVRAGLSARCGRALFLRRDSLVHLRLAPIVWYDRTQITGDSITALLSGNELREVIVSGQAFALSESRPTEEDSVGPPNRYDQMRGDLLHLWIVQRKASRVRIDRSAISLTFLYDGRLLNGVRRESGDLMIIDFDNGKLDTLHSLGNVEGNYWPEKFVTNREQDYHLDGFLLRSDRPTLPPR